MRTEIRVDGRGVARSIVHVYGRIDTTTENKTAPESALGSTDPEPDPNTYVGGKGAMDDRTKVRSEDRRLIALEYLQRAADDLSRVTLTRIRYIALARKYEATWRDIATALGLTETGARTLFNRNADIIQGGDDG